MICYIGSTGESRIRLYIVDVFLSYVGLHVPLLCI